MFRKLLKKSVTLSELDKFNREAYAVKFDVIQFQRKYRKFYKFSIISLELFCMTSKITGKSLMIKVIPDDYLEVRYSFHEYVYLVPLSTSKDLVQKLIKHNLI